jgi:putative transposase
MNGDVEPALAKVGGYKRLGILLQREGICVNHKKIYRLYTAAGLKVRRRSGRKRAIGARLATILPTRANQAWALDFVSDSFSCGRRFRILAVVDAVTKETLLMPSRKRLCCR